MSGFFWSMVETVSWDRPFAEPIELPKGKKLVTLRDAAQYITKLPKAKHDAEEWQAAMEALPLVAGHDGPTMFARIGLLRALNHGLPDPKTEPRRKVAKKYRTPLRMKVADAFDVWWHWAEKPHDSMLMIPAEPHDAVMALSPDERRDRAKVNEAARRAEQNREP